MGEYLQAFSWMIVVKTGVFFVNSVELFHKNFIKFGRRYYCFYKTSIII